MQLIVHARPARAADAVARLAHAYRQRHHRRARPPDRRHRPGSAALLYLFLRFTKLGWAVRATALDRDAAQQMGVDVNRVNQSGVRDRFRAGRPVSGLLVGMYYNNIIPAMGFQATLKGIVATMIGGVGNVPGAIVGSLLLGLIESYGIAAFGTSYRNLFAFVVLILILVWKPNGLFSREPRAAARAAHRHVHRSEQALARARAWLWRRFRGAALCCRWSCTTRYLLQTLANRLALRHSALSLTLVAGTAGQISLGHAGLLAIGAYASALLAIDLQLAGGAPPSLLRASSPRRSARADLSGFSPARALCDDRDAGHRRDRRAHHPELGQPDARPDRRHGIPPLSLFGGPPVQGTCGLLARAGRAIVLALLQWRLLGSHLGRTLRAMREDDVAARAYGVARPLQGAGLRLRRLCGRHQRRLHGAHLLLH